MSPMKKSTRKYWRSIDELNQSPAYLAEASHEFQDDLDITTPEENEGTSRRGFMGWVGAGVAASGFSGCEIIRRPEEKILPYSHAPEEILPGIAQYYATAAHVGGDVVGMLVESHEGRPTKLEGNPEHGSSYGGLNNIHQSMIMDLYDPQRLRAAYQLPVSKGLDAAQEVDIHKTLKSMSLKGKRVAVLAESTPSPQMHALAKRFKDELGADWYTYESVSDDNQLMAMESLFGESVRPRYYIDDTQTEGNDTKVILSLDNDFLAHEGPVVAYTREWANTRRLDGGPEDAHLMSRLYIVEARYSLTGSNADHRIRASHGQVETFAQALAEQMGIPGANAQGVALTARQAAAVQVVKKDLESNTGKALVLAGRNQPPVVHAIAAMINQKLGANGTRVKYFPEYRRPNHVKGMGDMASIKSLTEKINSDQIDALIMLGVNAAYSAPVDVKFADTLKKVKSVVYLADQADETSKTLSESTHSSLVIPRSHFLEAWGDLAAIDGQVSIQQPLIAPLHKSISEIELLAALLGDTNPKGNRKKGYMIVRESWRSKTGGAVGFNKLWRRWLHSGILEAEFNEFKVSSVTSKGLNGFKGTASEAPSKDALDVIFTVGHNSYDGRYANNSWLQELPDPMTKITWDNAALLSPATAKELGVGDEDMVKVKVGDREIESPAWVMPGQADHTVILTLGYGRPFSNYLEYHQGSYHSSDITGFDVTPVRSSDSAFATSSAQVIPSDGTYVIAAVQRYANSRQEPGFGFDARALVRESTVEEYQANPTFAQPGIIEHHVMPDKDKFAVLHPPEKSIWKDFNYHYDQDENHAELRPHQNLMAAKHQWGMVIDLNVCTGCNACMIACVAENNIPMVGKDQVRRGREMHWMRMDRYFVGSDTEPEIVHQPVSCQQCETAPCENVCPVAATVHSPEGLNDMVYNRCIGTRYCANNCPFKVRRFNFYNYTKNQDELFHMRRNPNVTVRFRGVMEKCTYCVQRINKGKRHAALNPEVSEQIIERISVACEQSCPAQGGAFGDLNNKDSKVSKLKDHPRNYRLLSELNIQPRTSYLAKIRNPNPEFPKADAEGSTQAG
jgi:molybdopterin-containing oxidoreductase family iron-sulfur binding subunit